MFGAGERFEAVELMGRDVLTRVVEKFTHQEENSYLPMGMRQYKTAHQSYREAVRLEPDNNRYRTGALDAALAMKKSTQLGFRIQTWLQDVLHTAKK